MVFRQTEDGMRFFLGIPITTWMTWLLLGVIGFFGFRQKVFSESDNLKNQVNGNYVKIGKLEKNVEINTDQIQTIKTDVATMRAEYGNELKHINTSFQEMKQDIREIKDILIRSSKK